MADFKPNKFTTPMTLHIPEYQNVAGKRKKIYSPHSELPPLMCSFKTYGGTDRVVDGVLAVTDTGLVQTWYEPAIKSDCALGFAEEPEADLYEIIGEVEDIERRHQYMQFRVTRVRGGA